MVAIKPPKQIKTPGNLKRAVNYILNEAKTLVSKVDETDIDFPLIYQNGEPQFKLASGHRIEDVTVADEEMIMTKLVAAFDKGDDDLKELTSGKQVLAHHIIQSFSPEDKLTPEQVHEIGRKTVLELTGGDYEFIVATHTDKDHLHNHIILSSTNSSSLRKFRWQRDTLKSLRSISDKYAEKYGAKIIVPKLRNSYTKYSAWRRQNNYRYEIKRRLNFLLKHSQTLEDFKMKAEVLDLEIDFSGKTVKYKLTDQPQKKFVRDDTLSKKGAYSLDGISKRVEYNEVTYDISELKEAYQTLTEKFDKDFENKLEIASWQVEQESAQGIYLTIDFGALNSGTILVPAHKVDKMENGNYQIYLKNHDYFFFLNPDNAEKNRYIMGSTVIKQLAKQNGELVITKNPYISSMRELIKEYNFLVQHEVTNGVQFRELEDRFNLKVREVDNELKGLDDRLARLHKIEGAMLALDQTPENSIAAMQLLEELRVPKETELSDIQQQIEQFQIEKGALQECFEDILHQYTDYQDMKVALHTREQQDKKLSPGEKTL